jgi:hypothetical protein
MRVILRFIVPRTIALGLRPALVLSALVWLGNPQGAQAGINEWTSNGPYSGSVPVLAVDPQTPSTLYAGGWGMPKSTDAGASWTAVLSYALVEALAIDPQTPTILYAGARFSRAFGFYPRFVKSADGGAIWSTLNIPGTNGVISALAIDPQTPAILYAGASTYGTFKSTDGGASWTAVLPVSVSTLAINPQTPAIVYAGGVDTVYKSSDGGSTWSAVDLTPEPSQSVGWVRALAIDPLTPTTLYAGRSALAPRAHMAASSRAPTEAPPGVPSTPAPRLSSTPWRSTRGRRPPSTRASTAASSGASMVAAAGALSTPACLTLSSRPWRSTRGRRPPSTLAVSPPSRARTAATAGARSVSAATTPSELWQSTR